MAQAVGGVVGAVVGFAVGGPAGAQWGWAIGSAIGTSFTTIKQPRIGDLAEVRAGEGGPRARVYGTFRPIGGQVVWSGKPREIRTRQSGKGGPKVESSTILRSYAIGICEGPIEGVRRIWRNNELVYDSRPGSEILAESVKWLEGKTILNGDWDQLPHPTIEAEAGAANAPAMRGTALLVVTDEDLTDLRGAIPAYQFEVGAGGIILDRPDVAPPGGTTFQSGSGGLGPAGTVLMPAALSPPAGAASIVATASIESGRATYEWLVDGVAIDSIELNAPAGTTVTGIFYIPAVAGTIVRFRRTTIANYESFPDTGSDLVSAVSYTQTLAELGLPPVGIDAESSELLPAVVERICIDAGVYPARIDVSALPNALVRGFSTSPEYTAASAILELAKVYFFDPQDADGVIRFIPRGGNFTAILTEDQFVEGEDEPEVDTTRDSISVPRLLHLTYFDVEGGQGTDKQFSERQISTRVESPTVLSTPVVLDSTTAAKTIQIQHKVMEEELRGDLVFGVSDQYLRLTEADVIVAQYRGRSQRVRIKQVVMNDGWQRLTCQRDRQSAYTATVQVVPPATVTRPPETIPGGTRFAFLDIPALTQAGDLLGYHLAASGETAGWRGAAIEREEAGGSFALLATDGTGTIMGTLTADLPLASEWYPDETNVLSVQLARADDDLEGITSAEWLARGNAAALVRADGTAEIVQFRNATETTPGVWALTGLQRGRLNSGASAHAAGAVFVMLNGSLFVQTGSERLATTLTHRAYSVGNLPATATTVAETWTGRSQREWPPIIESAARAADTLTVSWTPRHRFGSDENPVASTHFDGWQIDATDGVLSASTTTLTPSASFSVAGLSNPITVTVRGRNRLAGLGDPASRIVP